MRGERLRAVCRARLIAGDRALDADGEPLELDELVALVESVAASDVWERAERARAAGQLLVEVPFAVRLSGSEYEAMVARATNGGGAGTAPSPPPAALREVVEGVIDLAFLDEGGWVIADYKSDVAAEGIEPARLDRYKAQVGMYAAAWERLTGQPVRERMILFTADGRTVAW
jgi:ATP-dependent helicase/nuclease subunit A